MSIPSIARVLLRPLGAALALLALAPAVHATPFDTIGPFVNYSVIGGPRNVDVHSDQWVIVDAASADAKDATRSGIVHLTAQGGIGVGRASAQGSGQFYEAFIWSGWHDSIVVDPTDLSLAGQTARVSFKMAYDWTAQVADGAAPLGNNSIVGSAFVDVNVLRTGSPGQYGTVGEDIQQSCRQSGSCGPVSSFASANLPSPTFAGGVATFWFDVVLGASYDVVYGMNTYISATGGSVLIDAAHSMTWGGIQSITLGGQPLPATVTALSGLDMLSPVPEASTGALLCLGLASLLIRFRRS